MRNVENIFCSVHFCITFYLRDDALSSRQIARAQHNYLALTFYTKSIEL